MTRERWHDLVPPLALAAGIVASTLVAVSAPGSFWRGIGAPAILAASLLVASLVAPRRWGRWTARLGAAAVVGAGYLILSTVVAVRDPRLVALVLPTLGAGAWVVLFPRATHRSRACDGA